MAKTIYLLQYNNYFNRTVKGETFESPSDYVSAGTLCARVDNVTLWNPNDGVDTTFTTNVGITAIPDYAIVCEGINVLQRWFVMEAKRLQGQQYRLTMHRDLIVDNYDEILNNEDTFVERGWCDVSNPAIYNQEPLTFNQIKESQTQLSDKSCSPWIVGYLAINKDFGTKTIQFKEFYTTYEFTIDATMFEFAQQVMPGRAYVTIFMPYNSMTFVSESGNLTTAGGIFKAAAAALSQELSGSGALMDLQLLPFCPMSNLPMNYGHCGVPTNNIFIKQVDSSTEKPTVGYIGICTAENAKGSCYRVADGAEAIFRGKVYNIKEESITKTARLVSPNGNGVFEFVPSKLVYANDAEYQINYTMTPMPYQPYIKLEPTFARMYGNNFDDPRGLICGGDFALPQISDAWKTYQIQNKNYQVMFDRQIESMDKQQTVGLISDITGVVSGTVGGVAGGALSGSMIGGPAGAIAGGVAGGAASLVGGVADIGINAYLRADQREAAIQQHNWQLQNIKALPHSVTKVNSFNGEQPKLPYLEIYSCTANETDNLKKYLALRSYSINRYGRLVDYIKATGRTFLKGMIVRLAEVDDDSHYLAAIADEVNQGFYIEKGETA